MTRSAGRISGVMREAGRAGLVATLCGLMAAPQAVAKGAIPVEAAPARLSAQQRTLHALNRLTFGPRPGDAQALTSMGMEAWFQRQLHPETIDDAGFEARVGAFPALQLSSQELMRRFPTPAMIREMAKRDAPLPSDPVEHAIYADSIEIYKARLAKAGEQQPAAGGIAGGSMSAAASPEGMAGGDAAGVEPAMASQGAAAPGKNKGKGRKAMGVSPMEAEDVEAVLALAPEERVRRLVAMTPEEMVSFREGVKPRQLPALAQGLTPEQREIVAAMQGPAQMVGAEVLEERLLRDVSSERQLQAVMTDFWLNHFNVYVRKNQVEPYLLTSYERDTVLPNSLGRFEDLLVATAKSPAMLMYLDNWQSVGPNSVAARRGEFLRKFETKGQLAERLPKGINENYARELMELHTLGVGGGYTQQDVIEVAKCFTGWTVDRAYAGGSGGFVFDERRHEGGSKVVLGKTIPEGGMNEGLEVLHLLATSPATAKFVSGKLAQRFVSDTPAPAMVARMADTFVASDGDMKAVLTTMFHSPEFWAPGVYRAKVKTPIEFLASALRASDASVANPLALVRAMTLLGMPIYGMQTPNGYSWQADQWVSSNALVSRMNFALVLSGSRVPGVKTDWPRLLGVTGGAGLAGEPTPGTELKLETLLLGQPAGAHTRMVVLEQARNPTAQRAAEQSLAQAPEAVQDDSEGAGAAMMRVGRRKGNGAALQADKPETPLDTMAGLLMGSPDFQRR